MKWIYFVAFFFMAAALVGCSKDEEISGEEPNPGGETPEALIVPSDLNVVRVTYESVVVVWKGNASVYEVVIGDQPAVELEGTSCGIEGLNRETAYTWKVRGKRGAEVTDWVEGEVFTTPEYVDPRDNWVGNWISQKWGISVFFSGKEIPLDDFLPVLPEEIVWDELFALFSFQMEKEGGEGEKLIKVRLPLLTEFEMPDAFSIPVENDQFLLDQELNDSLTVLNTPTPIKDIPFISSIPELSIIGENVTIDNVKLMFKNIQIDLGPTSETGNIPAKITLSVDLKIKTSDPMIDVLISMLVKPRLRIVFDAELVRKELE